MSSNHIHRPGAFASAGAPFAQAREEAEQGAVRQLFTPTRAAPAPYAVDEQDVDPGAVVVLGAAAPEPELSGNGFTYRANWGARRGQSVLRLNWTAITPRSRVFVAIGEGAAGGPDAGKFIGSARYSLHNVAPRAGGVDIWVNVEWSSDILLFADYLIVNP